MTVLFETFVSDGSLRAARTADGRPWVRWVSPPAGYSGCSGWSAFGARSAEPHGSSFWAVVVGAAAHVTGRRMDQAESIGPSLLSFGALGASCTSHGLGQGLLLTCLRLCPERFVKAMAPVLHEVGVYPEASQKNQGGAVFVSRGKAVVTDAELAGLIRLGSDSCAWSSVQKRRAQIWVSSVSELLRDEAVDRAQVEFAAAVLPSLLLESTKSAIQWTDSSPTSTWQHTKEQQFVWALALVLAMQSRVLAAEFFSIVDSPLAVEKFIKHDMWAWSDRSETARDAGFDRRAGAAIQYLSTAFGVDVEQG